jgi:hypothetical protein
MEPQRTRRTRRRRERDKGVRHSVALGDGEFARGGIWYAAHAESGYFPAGGA